MRIMNNNLPPGVSDRDIPGEGDDDCPDHCEDKAPLNEYYHCPVCDREWFPEE